MRCPSCGGLVGVDCFNMGECILIGQAKSAALDAQPCDFYQLLAERDDLAATVQKQRLTIGLLHDATIILRNALSFGPEARDKAVQSATKLIDRAMEAAQK